MMRTPAMPARYLAIFGAVALIAAAPALWAWGQDGHFLVARLAVAALPADMPKFFTGAAETLVLLNPEPDTWRDSAEGKLSPALRLGHDPDHFFKFELYSPAALPPDRYSFLEDLRQQGKQARQVGMLPYRAMELFQRVRSGFRRWRAATDLGTGDPKMARFLEARIIDDAGLLGHYIADAAMPLHTSVNPNGWTPEENPRGYTRDNTLHRRFESDFVRARIHDGDVKPLLRETTVASDPFPYIYSHMRRSHDQMIPLYELEKLKSFGADNTDPRAVQFVAPRLADAASTLRDLWYTAWRTSAGVL